MAKVVTEADTLIGSDIEFQSRTARSASTDFQAISRAGRVASIRMREVTDFVREKVSLDAAFTRPSGHRRSDACWNDGYSAPQVTGQVVHVEGIGSALRLVRVTCNIVIEPDTLVGSYVEFKGTATEDAGADCLAIGWTDCIHTSRMCKISYHIPSVGKASL